ncbi:alpha/beta hydrolase [Algoriphagus sp. AGSA1]|uniref:alpha/beta hydrolase n=1 Tax=Algoriphagus sp. AGSA1 TaxID=2907213 RepID=UPI001F30AC19|nr:alpha/beta hydrolase [Algoriphagus sp. AGSA1]MCE7057870.1 alpha/beta hydrolase [Algoriphagus sp. AGSA1]
MNPLLNKFTKSAFLTLAVIAIWACSPDALENPAGGGLREKTLLNLSYGSANSQLLDIYLPAGRSTESTPLLIYIHGGAWVGGSKEEFVAFKETLTSLLPEYAFVAINYSLYNLSTGINSFPQQEHDVIDAVNYILSKAPEWNVSDKIILAGASAGGHLALLHAYKHQQTGNIQAVIAFFPPTDLTSLFDFSSITSIGLQGLVGGTPESDPEAYKASSPLSFVDQKTVPSIFFHGTLDTVVPISQSELLAKALQNAGTEYKFTIVPDEGHGFKDSTYRKLLQEASIFLKNLSQ